MANAPQPQDGDVITTHLVYRYVLKRFVMRIGNKKKIRPDAFSSYTFNRDNQDRFVSVDWSNLVINGPSGGLGRFLAIRRAQLLKDGNSWWHVMKKLSLYGEIGECQVRQLANVFSFGWGGSIRVEVRYNPRRTLPNNVAHCNMEFPLNAVALSMTMDAEHTFINATIHHATKYHIY